MGEDERFMRQALSEASQAEAEREVPVGAVVVRGGRVIGRGHNQREALADPTAHAEMIAITAAASLVGSWRLSECTLYVTLEPCAMCAGAILQARLPRIVFGAFDPKAGACGSVIDLFSEKKLGPNPLKTSGILAEESIGLLQRFFESRRRVDDQEKHT